MGMETKSVPRASSIRAQSSRMMWWQWVVGGKALVGMPKCMVRKEGAFLYLWRGVGGAWGGVGLRGVGRGTLGECESFEVRVGKVCIPL